MWHAQAVNSSHSGQEEMGILISTLLVNLQLRPAFHGVKTSSLPATMSSSKTSSKGLSKSGRKGHKQPVRVVLTPSQMENRAPAKPKLTWAEKAPAASSSLLSEEAWPAPVPKHPGKPTLGLIISPKTGSGRIRSDQPKDTNSVKSSGSGSKRSKGTDKENEPAGLVSSVKQEVKGGSVDPPKKRQRPARKGSKARRALKRNLALSNPTEQMMERGLSPKRMKKEEEVTGSSDPGNHGADGSHQKRSSMSAGSRAANPVLSEQSERKKAKKTRKAGSGSKDPKSRPVSGSSNSKGGSSFVCIPTTKRYITPTMLPSPSYRIEGEKVVYDTDFLHCEFPREFTAERPRKGVEVYKPSRPILVVNSLLDAELPVPQGEMPKALQDNPRLLLQPAITTVSHHFAGDECYCLSLGINGRSHVEAAVPDVCVKKDLPEPRGQSVRPVGDQLSENHSHFYGWRFKQGDHFLCVPPPFPLGGNWAPRFYEPAMAFRGWDHQARLYSTLYNAERYSTVANTYQREPGFWTCYESPVLSEASSTNKVGLMALRFYGLESIPRLGFTAHPASEPRIPVPCLVEEVEAGPDFQSGPPAS